MLPMPTTLRSHRLWFAGLALAAGLAFPASTLAATIYGTPGNDVLYGTTSADTIYGLAGHDLIYGRAGNDALYGGRQGDRLLGGLGDDWLYGGRGSDGLAGSAGSDHLSGGYGNDYIYAAGDDAADVIRCGPGVDHVIYGPGDTFADSSCEYTQLWAG